MNKGYGVLWWLAITVTPLVGGYLIMIGDRA